MTSYIPEYVYGHVPGTYGEMGLIPWPKHMTPREPDQLPDINLKQLYGEPSGVELTKKGEAYIAQHGGGSGVANLATPRAPQNCGHATVVDAAGVIFLTLDPKDRVTLATTIERLIGLLDDMECDPDLEEPGDLEPNIGWPERGPSSIASPDAFKRMGWPGPANDDREQDTADNEPWLGAPEHIYPRSQGRWCAGGYDDREEDCEDEGAQCDDEGVIDGDTEPEGVIWGGGSGDWGRVPA